MKAEKWNQAGLVGLAVFLFGWTANCFAGFDDKVAGDLFSSILLAAAVLFWFGRPWKWRSTMILPNHDFTRGARSSASALPQVKSWWGKIMPSRASAAAVSAARCQHGRAGSVPQTPLAWNLIAAGGAVFVFGQIAGLGSALALGCALVAGAVLDALFTCSLPRLGRLLLLWLAFPWVLTDLETVGWWFRLSAAAVTEEIFQFCGCEVLRNGTFLQVDGMNVSVEEACSGLKQLHLLLFTGTALAVRNHLGGWRLGITLLMLPVFAWVANTIRIIFITALGAAFGVEFASGAFHEIGGLLVIAGMFVLSWFFIQSFQTGKETASKPLP